MLKTFSKKRLQYWSTDKNYYKFIDKKSILKNIKSPRLGWELFYKMLRKIKRVYLIFPITFPISAPLKSEFNSCLVVLEPLTHNIAYLNKLKDSFSLCQLIAILQSICFFSDSFRTSSVRNRSASMPFSPHGETVYPTRILSPICSNVNTSSSKDFSCFLLSCWLYDEPRLWSVWVTP